MLQQIDSQDGNSIEYQYDAIGNLIRVSNNDTAIHRYGYDPENPHLLRVVTGPNVNESIFYQDTISTQSLSANLGNVTESSGQRYSATADQSGDTRWFAFDVSESQLQTLASGRLWVRVSISGVDEGFRPAIPLVYGATRIIPPTGFEQPDQGQAVAIYEITGPGAYLLSVEATQPGDFEVQLDVAGDLNADARVDGFDIRLFDSAAACGRAR